MRAGWSFNSFFYRARIRALKWMGCCYNFNGTQSAIIVIMTSCQVLNYFVCAH